MQTFKEINIDFGLFESNVFHFSMPDAVYLYNTPENDYRFSSYIEDVAYKLFTVCAILLEKPHIQFQAGSKVAPLVAKALERNLNGFFNKLRDEGSMRNPRATLLVLDRNIDLNAPMLHDFSYQSLVFDLLDTDTQCTVHLSEKEKVRLDEADELWQRMKGMHLAEVLNNIKEEVAVFLSENKSQIGNKPKGQMELADISE